MKIQVKSPLNYVGNKSKQITQLLNIFPSKINTFVDLFTGGGDVAANITADTIFANDINPFVINILKDFQKYSCEEVIEFIEKRIDEFQLSKINEEGYLHYRELYNTPNSGYNTPLDLFTISRYSFSQILRFNNQMIFNAAFGRNRGGFNPVMRNNLIAFHPRIQSIQFSSMDFRQFDLSNLTEIDFIYIDPPYLISNADYNTGKTAKLSWIENDENDLYNLLDNLHTRWAVSNFIKHKNKTNTILENWVKTNQYNIYNVNSDYSKLTSKISQMNEPTIEVVITNYDKNKI